MNPSKASTGGASTGGASTGGASTGGASTGGASTGGASTGATSKASTVGLSDASTWAVVGLGNPGPGYVGNRHNVGQIVVDELAARVSSRLKSHRSNSMVAEARLGGARVVLAEPNSFMNTSGGPVSGLLRFYKVPPTRLIVVHDELDLPFDTIRLKQGGGHGGHNGLRDIVTALGTPDFIRVRVGIGRPPGRQPAADFVLRDFSSTERQVLPSILVDAADAVALIVSDGLTAAQLKFHTAR